jgi:hypothetical protein
VSGSPYSSLFRLRLGKGTLKGIHPGTLPRLHKGLGVIGGTTGTLLLRMEQLVAEFLPASRILMMMVKNIPAAQTLNECKGKKLLPQNYRIKRRSAAKP